jgi:hypothetical protein
MVLDISGSEPITEEVDSEVIIVGWEDGAANQYYVDEVEIAPYGDTEAPDSIAPLMAAIDGSAVQDGYVASARADGPTLERPQTRYDYRSIYLSFGFEGINDDTGYTTRAELMGGLYNWLIDEVEVSMQPAMGTPEHRQCRYWMHYAEGSLMNWLVMKLVFVTIPTRPMPFFARPIARAICGKVQGQLIDPNLQAATAFIEDHLSRHQWFAGDEMSMADFQMSFAVEALLSRATGTGAHPHLGSYHARMRARPAYQRAEAKGGPTLMAP